MMGALWFLAACSSPPEQDDDPVAIEVGERAIRLSELQAQLDFLAERSTPVARDPGAFLTDYVERSIALSKARELGLDQEVAFRRQVENLLIGRLKQAQLDLALANVSVSDNEIAAYYDSKVNQYGRPAQSRVALLHLPTDKFTDEPKRRALHTRMQQARALAVELPATTRGFGALAMEYSEEATSRFKGGDIGWMQAGQERYRWPEPVVAAAFALDKGSLSEVIQAPDGFYLLKKIDSREPVVPALDGRFETTLRNALLREKRATTVETFEKEWAQDLPIKMHEEVLSHLEFGSPALQPQAGMELTHDLP